MHRDVEKINYRSAARARARHLSARNAMKFKKKKPIKPVTSGFAATTGWRSIRCALLLDFIATRALQSVRIYLKKRHVRIVTWKYGGRKSHFEIFFLDFFVHFHVWKYTCTGLKWIAKNSWSYGSLIFFRTR